MLKPRTLSRQNGLVLVLALVVLAAMTLAAIGLMRSVGGSNRVAGNLAFQQAAARSSEVGVERAVAWLEQQSRATTDKGVPSHPLFQSMPLSPGNPVAYSATRADPDANNNQSWQDYWTATLVPNNWVNTLPVDAAGNTVAYVIHRLCSSPGDSAFANCEATPRPRNDTQNNGKRAGPQIRGNSPVYYRITVLVQGPRNSQSLTQTIISL